MALKRILVQAGHLSPREPGHEDATGTTREQELTRGVRKRLVKLLKDDGRFEPIPAPGDIPDGIEVDAGIFLHGDGVDDPTASGYHFGFPDFAVNKRLAKLIGQEINKIPGHPPHRKDNATVDARKYYGFGLTKTDGPEVLVEHGFLTNPDERDWIFSHLDELANAEYVALCEFFGFEPKGEAAQPAPIFFIVEWTDAEGDRHRKRTAEVAKLVKRLVDRGIEKIRIRKE
jgi:hypothetical protein